MDLIATIREGLAALSGLPMWAAGRAASIFWFQFGARRLAPTDRDPARVAGEYALHLQCPWRLSGSVGVIAGASDIWVPADPDADEEEFRWDRPGAALVDAHLARWVAAQDEPNLTVLAVEVDRCGGFALRFPREVALEAFPDASSAPHDIREQWRLLRPGVEAPHLVVLNQGLE